MRAFPEEPSLAFVLHEWTAWIYLLASAVAVAGLTVRARRLPRAAIYTLALGVVVHTAAQWQLHELASPPQLTELPFVLSLVAWLAAVSYLISLGFARARGLAVLIAPIAFIGAAFATFSLENAPRAAAPAHPFWSHLHVLGASAGLAVLSVAGAAGVAYLLHHREIKAKRSGHRASSLPSLESLDRVNRVALGVGFTLLSLGLIAGVLWVRVTEGALWTGDLHANATAVAWAVYAVVVVQRFAARSRAHRSAVASAAAFAVLLMAVIGVRVLS